MSPNCQYDRAKLQKYLTDFEKMGAAKVRKISKLQKTTN
jgi:hypothetical protein